MTVAGEGEGLRGVDILLRALEQRGILRIWGFPATVPGFSEALRISQIDYLTARQASAPGLMADAVAALTSRPGVCYASSRYDVVGVAAAVTRAYLGGTPLLVLLGPDAARGPDTGAGRPAAGLDVVEILRPVIKRALRPALAVEIPVAVDRALAATLEGRPGPVLLVLLAAVLEETVARPAAVRAIERVSLAARRRGDDRQARPIREALARAERPVVMAGDEVVREGAEESLVAFAERFQLPVFVSFAAKGAIPDEHPLALGPFDPDAGHDEVVGAADLVLFIGNQVRGGVSRALLDRLAGKRAVFAGGWLHRAPAAADVEILADLRELLDGLAAGLARAPGPWVDVAAVRARARAVMTATPGGGGLAQILDIIRDELAAGDILVCDAGVHSRLVGLLYPARRPRTVLLSSAALGAAIPAAVGIKAAMPDRRVVAICGDPGLFLGLHELETSLRGSLPIVVVVLESAWFPRPVTAAPCWDEPGDGPVSYDAVALVGAVGGVGLRVRTPAEFERAFREGCRSPIATVVVTRLDEWLRAGSEARGAGESPAARR